MTTIVNDDTFQETDDVPVNKITSFNGKLSQFMHMPEDSGSSTPESTPALSMKRKPTPETEENQDDALNRDIPQTPSPTKRRKQAQASVTRATNEMAYLSPPVTRSRSSSASITGSPVSAMSRSRSITRSMTPTITQRQRAITPTPERISRRSRGRGRGPQSIQPPSPTSLSSSSSTPRCLLRDSIAPNLVVLLVGVNPGIMTGETGFAYAHPSNLFWKLLHSSGITSIRHPPSDTYRLPELYSVGNTNIVERPTRDASMLSKAEMNAGVPVLEAKVAKQRPEAVCLVGKSIWEAVWRVRRGRAIKKEEFK
ncbi:UreE_C, partial [Aspergillus sclerotialis]